VEVLTAAISAELQTRKLLLASDASLPSVAALVAGEPVRGSWWSHPKGRAIFAAIRGLEHDADALVVPLVGGKVTFVHRDLWPALLAVALAREPWQTRGLSAPARRLLTTLNKSGDVEASGDPARDLERRLLACGHEVHTERGLHAKHLERWDRWAARAGVIPSVDLTQAKRSLEQALADLGGGARRRLPWQA